GGLAPLPILSAARSLLDQVLGQQAHDHHVAWTPGHEHPPPAAALLLEPDLLVGPHGPRVDVVHREPDALEVHLPEPEAAQGPHRVAPESAVPEGLPDPDPQGRRSGRTVDILQATHPDEL